jgi:hypothetical protein
MATGLAPISVTQLCRTCVPYKYYIRNAQKQKDSDHDVCGRRPSQANTWIAAKSRAHVPPEPTDQTLRILSDTSKERHLRTPQHTSPECLTAFRLPKGLLETVNGICAELDCNRSQLIRRSLKEFIAFHELDRETTRTVERRNTP